MFCCIAFSWSIGMSWYKIIELCCLDNPVVFIVDYEYVQSIIREEKLCLFNLWPIHPPQPAPFNIHSSFARHGNTCTLQWASYGNLRPHISIRRFPPPSIPDPSPTEDYHIRFRCIQSGCGFSADRRVRLEFWDAFYNNGQVSNIGLNFSNIPCWLLVKSDRSVSWQHTWIYILFIAHQVNS